jgi:hypothetical protein
MTLINIERVIGGHRRVAQQQDESYDSRNFHEIFPSDFHLKTYICPLAISVIETDLDERE